MNNAQNRDRSVGGETILVVEDDDSVRALTRRVLESRGYQLLHYEDFQESEDSDFFDVFVAQNQVGPLDVLEDQRFRRALVQAIGVLPEREKIGCTSR